MGKIKHIQVIDTVRVDNFHTMLDSEVFEIQKRGLKAVIINPHMVVGAPPLSESHYVATVIGREKE